MAKSACHGAGPSKAFRNLGTWICRTRCDRNKAISNLRVNSVYSDKVRLKFRPLGKSRASHKPRRSGGRWAVRATTVVCLILLALLTVVQVAHVHPAATDTDHCPLCVVMHSAAPVALIAPAPVLVTGPQPIPVPDFHSVVRPWHCTLFNRPPPVQV